MRSVIITIILFLITCSLTFLGSHVKRNLVSLKAGKYAGIKLLGMGEDVAAAQDVTAMDPDHFQIEAIYSSQAKSWEWAPIFSEVVRISRHWKYVGASQTCRKDCTRSGSYL